MAVVSDWLEYALSGDTFQKDAALAKLNVNPALASISDAATNPAHIFFNAIDFLGEPQWQPFTQAWVM
jgi:hypothetical protein